MIINGKTYAIPTVDFSVIAKLEEYGIELKNMDKRPLGFVAGMVAVAMNCSYDDALKEINEHLKNGGDLKEISAEANEAIQKSDFFKKGAESA